MWIKNIVVEVLYKWVCVFLYQPQSSKFTFTCVYSQQQWKCAAKITYCTANIQNGWCSNQRWLVMACWTQSAEEKCWGKRKRGRHTVLCWWINDELWAVLLARPAELVNSACHCTVRDLFQITRLSVLSMRQERLQFFWRFFFENLFSFLINYHAWGGFLSLINLRLLCIQKIKSTWMGYRHWWELWCKVLHLKIGSL